MCRNPFGSGGNRVYTNPFVHSRCSCFNRGSIWGFSPGLWNSERNPSWNTRVETAGVEEEASAEAAAGGGLAATVSFFALIASLLAFAAASSLVPNRSVKTFSRDVLISATFAHLPDQLQHGLGRGCTHLRSDVLFLIPPISGPILVQLSGAEGSVEMYDLSSSGSWSTWMSMPVDWSAYA